MSGDPHDAKHNRAVFVWEVSAPNPELRMEIIDIAPILKTIDHSSGAEFEFDERVVQSVPLSTIKSSGSCLVW